MLSLAPQEKWQTHTASEAAAPLDCTEILLRLSWLAPEVDALRAIIRRDGGHTLFAQFLQERDKRAKVRGARPLPSMAPRSA